MNNKKQTTDFLMRVDRIKQYFFENRDREVAQVEVTEHFKLTHFATRSACERLEVTQALDSYERRGKRYYKWRTNTNDPLYQFMRNSKMRVAVREFRL